MSKVTNKVNPINYDWWKEDEEKPQETTDTSEIPESVVVDMPKEETKDDTSTVSPPSYKRPIHETVVEENPDKELLERMQMSADLSKFATGLQWDSIHNTLRNAGVNPVSAKIAEDRLKGDKEVGDYLTQIGMPVDEEGYLDMNYKPTEKGWGKKIYDEYIKKGYLEAERDANGNIVNLRRNREASVAPFIEEAVRNTPLPKSFTAGSQSKYFSDITQSVIAQMPKDENGRILYNGQYFPFEEVYTGLYPAIAQKVHEDMLDSNKEYFDANFLRATGQTYEDWYRDFASKRVDEMEVRIGELRDAVAADAEKVAYAKGREVAMSSATLVPASVLGWASGKGAAAESKKMFDDALEEINNFRKNNFGSGFQESFDTLGFLTFGLADLGSTYTQMQLLEKARRGDTLSDTEKNVLELLNIQQEFATIKENLGWEASLGSKIGSGVGATVEILGPFGGAMMGTSMVGNVVKLSTGVAKGAFKANVKAVGKNILNNTLVGYMRGAIAAPLMPNTYAEYTKALKSQYKFNEDGSISFTPTNKRLAYMSAYIDGMNEIASEVYGSTIGELIGYGARTFGRVAKLNKVVDALYTPVSKKVDDVLSKVGDTPKAMAFRRAVSNFVDPMKGLDPETRELLRVAGVQDGIFAEAMSEIAGDFMATVMKDMVGAEVNYDDYHDKDFWLMQLAVAGLYGGTMSTIGKAGEAVSTYDYIAGVGEQNRRIIDSIESAELRDMLLAITADGNIDRAYIKLAGIDWSAYHPTDKDKAASFVRGSYALHAAMGSVQEDTRAKAFAVEAQKLTNNAYRGKDISTPVGNDATIMVAESEGRRYYVIAGVPADKSDTSMLTCVDMETGEQKAILSSKANVTSIEGVNDLLEQRYTELFSAQVEAERIESIKSAYGQMERPTAEIAKSLMAQCGIIPPKEGDVVTLADGRSVEVMQDLEDGTYVVRLQDKVPLLFTVPFYNLKSNDTLTAAAQELMLEGKVENATREAVEVAEKAVENGAEVATTEAPSAQSNAVERRLSIKEVEAASEAQATIEAQEADVANAVEEMENIPTTEDGEVDYDAIKSPKTFAKTYVKEAGSVKQAHTEVKEMRAAAEQELQKIVERGGKEYTASKKRAAAREQRAIQERIAFYDAVAREMELLETKTEAEFSNIIENEYSVQVSAPVKKVVDGLAKELGLKVRFVEDAAGQNAYILGNEVVISHKNRQKSIAFLIGHEYTHRMQDASPKQYAKFKSMVRETIGEERWNSLVENLKKEYEKQGKSITDTQLEDEVTADAAGELVENRDVFIEHLQHKASDVGFLGFLRKIFRGLANTLRRIGATDREKTILDIVSQLDYLIDSAARNVAKASAESDARYSARVTPEMDAGYMEAVEKGDMETAQQLVMEAAKLAMPNTKVVDEDGNPKVVYHQTNATVYINRETGQNWDELDWRERMEWDERDDWEDYWEEQEFNTFSRVNARTTNEFDGFFFAPVYDEYHEYGDRTIEAFLNIENPASREDYYIDSSKNNAGRDERIRLQNEGYDGVIREEDGTIWEYVAFNPNQIKSADPVTYDDAGNVIPLSERFNPEKEDIRYSIMQPTNEEVTFDNFFRSTSAVFEIIPKSEVPQREPDYVSERWDGFGVSSRYWYGEDERGKYVIRESDHWSSFPQGENTRKAFETEPYNKRYTRIASCRWALAVSKKQVTTDKEAYLDGNKMYGKAYLDEFTKWEDASASAPTAETQTITTANGDMVANVNEATGQGRFSLRTYREGGRDVLADFLATRVADRALTEREASEMMQQMDDIYNLCMTMADEYEPFGKWSEAKVVEDENGNPVFSVIKANGDYAMNLDFSLVCKKRRTLDAVLNEMVKRGMIKGVSQKDTTIAKINEVIRKYGFETACALCFVDARRFQILRTARKFCDLYNEVVDMLIPKNKRYPINEFNFAGRSGVTTQEGSLETIADEELNVEKLRKIGYKVIGKTKEGKDIFAKTVLAKIARHLVEHPEDRKYLVPSDFVSTRGFDHVKQMRPLIMKLYNAKKGTGGPKAAYSDTQYLNDIIRSNWKVENAYAVGGVRLQSFSDYVPRMVFDYIQMVAELAAKELPVHAYTKEPLFAKTFGLTGIKINLSLVPDVVEGGVAAGLDADGNYVWRQGETFPYEEAIALQNAEGYRDNCGTIAVGVSDAHILKMLDDPNIRMVIPYHKSGLPVQVAKMNNVAAFTDYTKIQNTTRKGRSLTKEEAAKVPNYNEFLQKLKDPRKAAAAYVAWCQTKGYTPKFAKFAEHPNYYKLLEDFTTLVDNKYVPQGAVTFTFPTEESAFGSLESLIEQGLEEDAVTEGMRDARVGAIVDEVGEVLGVKPRYSVRTEGASIFYSNAQKAVLEIKQEKATPEQWLKMIEKAGGLKAGEDKWLGLSDWLKASTAKTLTKDEVLQYIAENDIQIEEVQYSETNTGLLDRVSELTYDLYDIDESINSLSESIVRGKQRLKTLTDAKRVFDEKAEALKQEYGEDSPKYQNHVFYDSYTDDIESLEASIAQDEEYYNTQSERADAIRTEIETLNEKVGDERGIDSTRLDYTTRGLTNKREIALVVPTIESYNQSDEIHFGDAGEGRAVAWIRFGETTDADGKRVLVIDEIQSKRHQDGREKGYSNRSVSQQELYEVQEATFSKVIEYESALADKYGEDEWATLATAEEMAEYERLRVLDEAATNAYENYDKGVPSAPFEKNWAELAFKRMLRYAAENGYDYVAWTTGDQQAERYNIGNVIERVVSYPVDDNMEIWIHRRANERIHLVADNNGVILNSNSSLADAGTNVSEVLGKDLSKRIYGREGEDATIYAGRGKEYAAKEIAVDGLRIGGEGMRGFYDQMLPSFVKKYTKKWGAEVGEVTMPALEENNTMHAVNVTDSMRESVMQGQPKFSLIGEKGAAKIFEDDTYGTPAVDLEVAREMEAEGKDALSIRLATGWERGADDKWRYEIMDGEYHHPADMSQPVRLSDILDNPALYEAYPDLADMKVEYKPLDENRNGYYDGRGIVINSEKGQAQNESTLIHEIQHAIQHREGFAQGGNSKSFEEGLDEIEEKLTVLKGDFDNLIRSGKGEHLLRRLYIATKALGKMLQINYLNAKKDIIEYDAYQRYRKLAGEVEARNVQARHAMSRHERAWTPIGETEDVARESQEFVYRTAASSSDVPRYSVRREDVDNGNIDNVIESLDTARAELERIIRDKKLTNAEKNAVMRGVKALISQELRDGLSRFTRKNDILRMMDAVNEAKAPNAMLNAVNRAMQSIYGIKYRKEFARMASLTKSKITLGVTNVDPEAFLDRLVREKKITDTEARRVIDNYWKGVNASGVSIARYVDNDTRQVMEFVNAMMDIEKAKALLSPDMKKKMSLDSPPQDIIRAVRITIENDEIADGKLAEALKDESLKQQIIDITDVLEEYWIALDLYNSISEDMTAEEVNSVMPDVIEHMANANAAVEELLRSGKVKLSEERKQRKMQERYLIYDALQDMGVTNAIDGRILEDTRDFRRRVWHRVKGEVGKWPGAALGSMEYMLRKIGVNAPMGEGRIFNHFAPKLQRAYDKTFAALAECNKALDDKCKSLWGKTYAEMQKMAENTKVGQTYHERDIYVTQAIYLLAMWEQPDARAALEKKQGMDVALVDNIRQALDALDPRWREFSEWVVKEFLPSRREKYNAVHRKIFGTSLGCVPNYFPIKRAGESIHSVVDVSIPEMDALPSTIVGSIVERTKNVLPIDVETSFFEALNDNLTTMEGWAEMVGIIRDFNTLLSNRTVREAMNDIAPNMHSDFKKAAQVATLSYVGKTPDIDKNVGTVLSRMWAGTKISFRLYTAFKQLSSALLFAGYSGDPKFQAILLWRYLGGVGKMPVALMNGIIEGVSHLTGHSLTNIDIMTNIKWCMENLPSFRQRWESGVAGMEVMKRTLGNKSWKQRTWVNAMDEVVQKVAKFGFKPNAFVDAFTVAAGARTIFDYEYKRLQEEEGYNEKQARVLAIVKAEMAFNSSQQSSEGLYLAPLQVDRSLLSSAASTFMNASFAMSRNATQGIYELIRSASKELAEIEDITYRRMIAPYKKVIKETITEERAAGAFADENAEVSRYTELMEAAKAQVLPRVKEIAKKKLRDAKIKAVLAVIIYGYGGQLAFQLMAELPTLLFGDDDEEKKQIVKDTAINSLWSAPLSMIPLINLIPAAVAGYRINLFPAVDELGEDIGKILKGIAKDGVNIEVAKITALLGLRWGLGLDIDTWKNVYLGVESMLEDGVSAEAILKVMNGPETQIRKIIGQRRDDESEKEYIERIMRFYSIAENPMFSEYPDAGKYYEGYEIEGKGINYFDYHGGSPKGMTDRDMQRIDYEKAYRRNIVLRYGGGKEYARHQEIDEKFNEYAKTIGSPNDVYWRGYYEPKMENLGEKEWSDLMTLKAEVNGYEKWLQHFTGSDESYYEVVKEVEGMKQKFNETYEQFK